MIKNLKDLPSIEAAKQGALRLGRVEFSYKDSVKDCAVVLTLRSGILDPNKQKHLELDGRTWCCFLSKDGYPCDFGKFAKKTRVDLARHEMTHCIGGYQCSASGCSKKFHQKSQLETHERTHTKKMKFECKTCNRQFADQSSANRHEHTKEGHKYREIANPNKKRIQRRPRAGPTAQQQMQPTIQQELPAFGSLSGASLGESQPLDYFGDNTNDPRSTQHGISGVNTCMDGSHQRQTHGLDPIHAFSKSCDVSHLSRQQILANKVSGGGCPMPQHPFGGFCDSNFDAMDNFDPFGNQPQHQISEDQWLYSSSSPQQNSSHNPDPPLFVQPQELEFNSWHGADGDVGLELNNSPQWDPNVQASYTNGTGSDALNAQAAINAPWHVDNSAGSAYPVNLQAIDPDLLDLDSNVPSSTGPSLPFDTQSP